MITTFRTRFMRYVTGRTIARARAFRRHGSLVLSMRLAATAYAWRAAHARTMFTTGASPTWTGDRNNPTVTASPFGHADSDRPAGGEGEAPAARRKPPRGGQAAPRREEDVVRDAQGGRHGRTIAYIEGPL